MARTNMQSHELGSNGLMNYNGPPQYSPAQPNKQQGKNFDGYGTNAIVFQFGTGRNQGVKQRTRFQSRYEGSVMETGPESKPQNEALIKSFVEITSSSSEEARFFLESHNWDLDAAVSTFLDSGFNPVIPADSNTARQSIQAPRTSPSPSHSPDFSPSRSPSRSRSPSPPMSRDPYELRSRRGLTGGAKSADHKASGSRGRGIRTLADLNRAAQEGSGSDSDEPQEYYTGGEKSGMLVQDPSKHHDVDAIFNQARQSQAGVERHARASSSSKGFKGTGRLLSGETLPSTPQPPEVVTHTITFWRNGFSIDDGPLRRLDDPENAPFLESIRRSERPKELEPADRRTCVEVHLVRRDENYPEPVKLHVPFQGVGRTLGGETSGPATPLITSPLPSMGLIVDDSLPTTSIQLRLADGTRMVSRFNNHHTIRDVRSFIDASRPDGARSYHLQSMGFPPKKLTELDQTIEEAGIANSVVIQKF